MARLGILGGTFDPIHNGHLLVAELAAKQLQLDKVLFVPTGDSWQKSKTSDSSARAEMVRLAISGNPLFELDLTDVNRTGATYTVDTLRDIRKAHPNDELFFILGTDAFASIETWKDYEQLFSLAQFVLVTRPGFDLPTKHLAQVKVVEIDALDLSSTNIRSLIVSAEPVLGLVPELVAEYIKSNHLYQEHS